MHLNRVVRGGVRDEWRTNNPLLMGDTPMAPVPGCELSRQEHRGLVQAGRSSGSPAKPLVSLG